ncbi:MAG TPA: AAA family ATPase [Candidatus Bathyarchaeota archaeon]|nr:AAA family ATPase [Candidatus Bathyarchaeota archaeon]
MSPRILKEGGESKLSFTYIPQRLPHREKQREELLSLLLPVVKSQCRISRAVYLYGPSGSGKTATVKLVLRELRNRYSFLKSIFVNCRFTSTEFSLFQQIAKKLVPSFPTRGYSSLELLVNIYEYITKNDICVIIVLDEFDVFIKRNGVSSLRDLLKIYESTSEGPSITLILITMEPHTLLNALPIIRLKNQFKKYSVEDLYDIVLYRAEESFVEGVLSEELAYLISRLGYKFGYGSARYCIELLQHSGYIALLSGLDSIEHWCVIEAFRRMEPSIELFEPIIPPKTVEVLESIAMNSTSRNPYVEVRKLLKILPNYDDLLTLLKNMDRSGYVDLMETRGVKYVASLIPPNMLEVLKSGAS